MAIRLQNVLRFIVAAGSGLYPVSSAAANILRIISIPPFTHH
ncbi:hypothetical protein ACFLYL_00995 [Chloroflexota bacterium]